MNGALSMSANGRLLAFPAFGLSATSKITQQDARILPAGARAGPVAERSRIVRGRPHPPCRPLLVAAALSPGSRTLCTCVALGQAGRAVRVSGYQTRTGRLHRTLATLTVPGSAQAAADYCSMALDRSGRYVLAPYAVRHPRNPGARTLLRIALVAVSTGRGDPEHSLPGGGMDPATGMTIAW
jgi:hypothetical protein